MEKTTILFDMDNTLIDRDQAAKKTFWDIVNHTFPDKDLAFRTGMFERLYQLDDNGDTDKRVLFGTVASEYGLDQTWVDRQIHEVWNQQFPRNTIVFPKSLDTIRKLKRYYKVGILTNGLESNQYTKYFVAGLDQEIDMILVSGSLRLSKPDPILFQEALKRMGSEAEQTYYVGDNIKKDIEGAMRVGMTPIYIWPNDSKPCPYDVMHIYTIEQLLEVIPCPIK